MPSDEELAPFRPRIVVALGEKRYELNAKDREPKPPTKLRLVDLKPKSPFLLPDESDEPCTAEESGLNAFPADPSD